MLKRFGVVSALLAFVLACTAPAAAQNITRVGDAQPSCAHLTFSKGRQ